MTIVPYDFDPPSTSEDDPRLIYEQHGKTTRIRWPLVSVDLLYPEARSFPSIDDIVKLNAGAVINHRNMGFSIGSYHEFFIGTESEISAGFDMGGIEATFGQATPLAVTLFEASRSKYHNDWEAIWTLRLLGVRQEDVETAVLNALHLYHDEFGEHVTPYVLSSDYWDEEDFGQIITASIVKTAPIVSLSYSPVARFACR